MEIEAVSTHEAASTLPMAPVTVKKGAWGSQIQWLRHEMEGKE